MTRVSAVLLGAGESKRMGVNKLTLPWGRQTVFEHSLKVLLSSKVSEIVVVLSDRTKEIRQRLEERRVKIVMNRDYRKGMSTSVRKGVRATDPKSHGILIALGDQPFLRARTINALLRAFSERRGTIVVPSCRGRRGHPVIFHRRYARELMTLKGDVGGRSLIEKYPAEVRVVGVRSEGVIKDLDTWKEYKKAQSSKVKAQRSKSDQ